MDLLCSDKTGTLTTGHLEMQVERVIFSDGTGLSGKPYACPYRKSAAGKPEGEPLQDDLLMIAALGADWSLKPGGHIDPLIMLSFDGLQMVTMAIHHQP